MCSTTLDGGSNYGLNPSFPELLLSLPKLAPEGHGTFHDLPGPLIKHLRVNQSINRIILHEPLRNLSTSHHLAGAEWRAVEVESNCLVTVAVVSDPMEAKFVAHISHLVGLDIADLLLGHGPVGLDLFRGPVVLGLDSGNRKTIQESFVNFMTCD